LVSAEERLCGQLIQDDDLGPVSEALRQVLFIGMYLHLFRDHVDLSRELVDYEQAMAAAAIMRSKALWQAFKRETSSSEKGTRVQKEGSLFKEMLKDMSKKYWEAVEEIRDIIVEEEGWTSFVDVLRGELEEADLSLPSLKVEPPEGTRKAEASINLKWGGIPDRDFQTKEGGVLALAAAFEVK
jgi:hypothetical protein